MKKNYVVTEVKAVFNGIPDLPQKEALSLNDILASLPNLFKGTSYEADTYEVSFLGYFKTKAVVFVNSPVDRQLSYTPITAYSYYGLFKVNGELILISFRTSLSAMIFIVKMGRTDGQSDELIFEKHELVGNSGIMVKRSILSL